jgi:hypothetical protein
VKPLSRALCMQDLQIHWTFKIIDRTLGDPAPDSPFQEALDGERKVPHRWSIANGFYLATVPGKSSAHFKGLLAITWKYFRPCLSVSRSRLVLFLHFPARCVIFNGWPHDLIQRTFFLTLGFTTKGFGSKLMDDKKARMFRKSSFAHEMLWD